MPFQIIHNDITKMNTDAIVNAANSSLQMGGGVCGAIFREAGEQELQTECNKIGKCPVGQAVITKVYNLSSKFIIHTVGPIWRGGKNNEPNYLASAYENSLKLAKQHNLKSIAFPLISSGIYGYPKEEALQIAISTISEFLLNNDMDVYLVVFDRKAIVLSEKLFTDINSYIDTYYENTENTKKYREAFKESDFSQVYDNQYDEHSIILEMESYIDVDSGLENILNNLDETFSEMLLRIIDEKGKTDVEVYKKANIDRKLFSKIRSNKEYTPKKNTVLAFAIALELSLKETQDILSKAGYSLSPSRKFDVIIQYFIENKIYNIFKINEALFCFEQTLLG